MESEHRRGYYTREQQISPTIGILTEYLKETDPKAAFDIARRLEQQGTTTSLLYSGDVLLETARRLAPGDSARSKFLLQAAGMWRRALQLRRLHIPKLDFYSGRALVRLANLPLYRSHVMTGMMPSAKRFKQAYWGMVEAGSTHLESLAAATDPMDQAELIGNLCEIETNVLLQRFGLRLGDRSWMAVPADLSHDITAEQRKQWDISIFTQVDRKVAPSLTYRVQVKATRNAADPKYADGIVVVRALEDLCLTRGKKLRPGVLINECQTEFSQPSQVDSVLDARTEKLLDILDSAA